MSTLRSRPGTARSSDFEHDGDRRVTMASRPRLSAQRRWQLYRRLARYPTLTAVLRARRYDKRELLRQQLEVRLLRDSLDQVRAGRDVCWLEGDDEEPLVTVAIPTYKRPEAVERAVRAALAQTYERIEVLVVGDHTDDDTGRRLEQLSEPRVRFVDLGHQGVYPTEPRLRWLVAGAKPMDVALDLARGSWIANCDDDDELLPNHVETLLMEAKRRRLELVYGQAERFDVDGTRHITGSEPLRWGAIVRGSAMYSLGLRFVRYEQQCWRIRDPADWNLWKRMQLAGVRIGFTPVVTYRH